MLPTSFNTAFLNLNDSSSFTTGNVLSVLMLTPTFLSSSLREVLSPWERLLTIIDELHQGKLDFANHTLYHVSRVGLLKPVVAEVFAIRGVNRELLEFIIIETLLPSDTPLHCTKTVAFSGGDTNIRGCHLKWVDYQVAFI